MPLAAIAGEAGNEERQDEMKAVEGGHGEGSSEGTMKGAGRTGTKMKWRRNHFCACSGIVSLQTERVQEKPSRVGERKAS